jgi:alpha-tubulin suppressor-like RCC1 family protein
MSASQDDPISFFVDAGGSLRACEIELQNTEDDEDILAFLRHGFAAFPGSLGFGRDWHTVSDSDYLRKEEPTLVPATEGVRMRSVAVGDDHSLALTDDGQVYMWGPTSKTSQAPEVPTLFEKAKDLTVRRVAVGMNHCAALTGDGKLFTWLHDKRAWDLRGASGAGYPLPDLGVAESALCRPKCVEALAGMRIVLVAAGAFLTIVAADEGVAWRTPLRLHMQLWTRRNPPVFPAPTAPTFP